MLHMDYNPNPGLTMAQKIAIIAMAVVACVTGIAGAFFILSLN
jgi:hypothetical protein